MWRNVAMMPPACDYKRLLDGDQGPVTGGMGAYTPTKYVTPELWARVETKMRQASAIPAVEGQRFLE